MGGQPMTPEDITAELSARLRHQRVDFDQAALDAFAVDACRMSGSDRDIDMLVQRF